MRKAIEKNARILALFAIACTATVGLVNELTKGKIARQEQAQLLKTLHDIIDPEIINNDLYQSCLLVTDELLGNNEPHTVYLAKHDEKPVAAAITTTAPDGYSGNIELIVALNYDGKVSGVRTLKHQETPGLGDKVEIKKSDWITSFTDKLVTADNQHQWAVSKDGGMFDQFTGATITPRAVVKAVKNTALYFQQHKAELFSRTDSCRENL